MEGKIREGMHEEEEQELSHISKDLECTPEKCDSYSQESFSTQQQKEGEGSVVKNEKQKGPTKSNSQKGTRNKPK